LMLALVFDGEVKLRNDYPTPKPRRDEALVAVRMGGVCKTDLEIVKGYMNFRGVMGHEFVGTVVAGPKKWKNKRVVAEINCVCGRCDMCRKGLSNHCRNRTVVGISGREGAFAEHLTLPVRNLHEVPEGVRDEEAVFVEPLAAALQLVRQVKFDPASNVVILGDGRLGQLIARVLKPMVRLAVLVGKHPSKLEAAEKQGIQTILVEDFVPDAQGDVVVDATGSPSGFELAMKVVRPKGTIVLKSTFAAGEGVNLSPIVINEVKVVGSRCGPFPDALRALAEGRVDVAALITGRYPLTQGPAALTAAENPDAIKVLIDVQG
jgi:threonine dehydrogenase-like Zn-dependent dehydrogenase